MTDWRSDRMEGSRLRGVKMLSDSLSVRGLLWKVGGKGRDWVAGGGGRVQVGRGRGGMKDCQAR